MGETPLFLENEGQHLYAVHHEPPGEMERRGGVVLVHPFAEEKKAAQRALVETARALTVRGFEALRFDFRGEGDSEGEFGDSTIETRLSDLRAAAAWLQEQVSGRPLGLLGLRLGGTLALTVAEESPEAFAFVVLWEPIVNGARYMRQNLQRSRLRQAITLTEGTRGEGRGARGTSGEASGGTSNRGKGFPAFDFDGFWVNADLHRQMADLDLLRGRPKFSGLLLLVQISGSTRPRRELVELQQWYAAAGAGVTLEVVRLEPFWSTIGLVAVEPVIETTLHWLLSSNCVKT